MGAPRVLALLSLLAVTLAVAAPPGNAVEDLRPSAPTPRPFACVVHGACDAEGAPPRPLHLLLFMTAWRRLPLTAAVCAHYARLRHGAALAAAGVVLAVHVAGSGGAAVEAVAAAAGASYSEHPNTPLGAKHVAGLAAGRAAHPRTDGVVVVGSDDLLPAAYLVAVADRLRGGRAHLVGLADLGVVDLGGWTAAYSAGYRPGANPVASTVGLGRAYSAALLDALAPRGGLWEAALPRGLDQSASRRLLTAVPAVVAVADVLVGGAGDGGLAGVDVKTGGAAGGVNLWGYDALVGAGGDAPGQRLRRFERRSVEELVRAVGGRDAVADLRAVRAALAGGENATVAAGR